jgi:hypothetical protein
MSGWIAVAVAGGVAIGLGLGEALDAAAMWCARRIFRKGDGR